MSAVVESYAWRESYRLGIPVIDAEHRRFFDILNGLHEIVRCGGSPAAVSTQLAALEAYAASHFRNEEEFLEAVDCPDLELQREEHARYREHLRRMARGGAKDGAEALEFARDWLLEHVLGTDRRYTLWISAVEPTEAMRATLAYGRATARGAAADAR